jgi:hypothetical protein
LLSSGTFIGESELCTRYDGSAGIGYRSRERRVDVLSETLLVHSQQKHAKNDRPKISTGLGRAASHKVPLRTAPQSRRVKTLLWLDRRDQITSVGQRSKCAEILGKRAPVTAFIRRRFRTCEGIATVFLRLFTTFTGPGDETKIYASRRRDVNCFHEPVLHPQFEEGDTKR